MNIITSLLSLNRVLRQVALCSLFCALGWAHTIKAQTTQTLDNVYLYSSPVTAAFFTSNGTNYDAMKGRWREYLRTLYGNTNREVSRASLLAGLKPGVLILGSAVLLDDEERKAIQAYTKAGGSVLATWGTGARNGKGQWAGYGFIEDLLQMKVLGPVTAEDNLRFINTFGDHPLTWAVPGGQRIFLGVIGETPLRVSSPNLAARYFDWQRFPGSKEGNGAIAFLEKDNSRRVYLGFPESSWEYDSHIDLPKMLESVLAWLRHKPTIYKSAWPHTFQSAQLLEMDTEDKFPNALNFAAQLDAANMRGTFYSLTSIAVKNRDVVQKLAEQHEIGYHAEVHVGFKGKSIDVQKERINTMVSDMKDIVGSRALYKVSGFRAPTESWDDTTEKLLRKNGVLHHVADPASSEARVPGFSISEPGLNSEEAIVVLPRTQMDDLNYKAMKLSLEKASELIMLDFDYLHEAGALGVLSVHSQNYGTDGLMTKLTPPYIKRLQQHRAAVWVAAGHEIAEWWRIRERVIVDPSKVSATKLEFNVRAPGNVKGIKFFVTHPSMDAVPKLIKASSPNAPQPELRRVDAYRSSIIFPQELKTGHYVYNLEF
jgi:peptidoglycan/xylan/chitin deacetylase (PgdA/CDA1 family)